MYIPIKYKIILNKVFSFFYINYHISKLIYLLLNKVQNFPFIKQNSFQYIIYDRSISFNIFNYIINIINNIFIECIKLYIYFILIIFFNYKLKKKYSIIFNYIYY